MKIETSHRAFFYRYLVLLGLLFVTFLTTRLSISPFSITLLFLVMILAPGYLVNRLAKISFEDDHLGNLMLTVASGFVYNLFLMLVGLFLALTINQLIWFYLIISFGVLISAITTDYLRKPEKEKTFEIKSIFKSENIVYIFLGLFGLAILAVVTQLGTNFTGDPMDHLSIMRKVYDGAPITIENLSWMKAQFHPAYFYNLWHILSALATKFTRSNIFEFYRAFSIPLTIFTMLVWYWLWLKIFSKTKYLAVLAWIFVMNYIFLQNGYLFTRLPIPDTLCQIIFLPLTFGLAIKYIFSHESKWSHFILLSVFAVTMGVVHWTQYFYYQFTMGLFFVFYAVLKYSDNDYRERLKKILLSIIGSWPLVAISFIYTQYKGGTVVSSWEQFSEVNQTFKNWRFNQFQPLLKFGYLLLPFTALFIRKHRRLIFILAIMLIAPIVFNIPGLWQFLQQYMSHVFVKRFYASVEWPFAVFALFFGFIMVLVDRIISRLSKINTLWRYVIEIVLALKLLLVIYWQFSSEKMSQLYDKIFSEETRLWINGHIVILFAIIISLVIILYIYQKYSSKFADFFQFEELKDKWSALIITLLVLFFFSLPGQGHLINYSKKELSNSQFFSNVTDPTFDIINPQKFGGMETIDFIRQNIPSKSVFDSTDANYVLPMLVDMHMASLTFDPEPTKKYADIYNPAVSLEKRIELIKAGQINYILYLYGGNYSTVFGQTPFDQAPNYFLPIYSNDKAVIYQVQNI